MSNSVRPHRRQPTKLPRPWDSPGKNTGVGCHFLLQCMKGKSESEVAQSCPTLSDPMDCSPPGSSVHGIFQARVLEWGAIAFSAKGLQYVKYVTFTLFPDTIKDIGVTSIPVTGDFCAFHRRNGAGFQVFVFVLSLSNISSIENKNFVSLRIRRQR